MNNTIATVDLVIPFKWLKAKIWIEISLYSILFSIYQSFVELGRNNEDSWSYLSLIREWHFLTMLTHSETICCEEFVSSLCTGMGGSARIYCFFHLQMGIVCVYMFFPLVLFPGLPRPRNWFVHRLKESMCKFWCLRIY